MKILLVEDSATIRYAMCMYIEASGHETVVAESGEEALQILDTTPVDMVITDVEMPGLDGFETTRLIREWLGDHWIPIIFVTGKSEDTSLEEGIAAGGDDYIIKPINQTILTAKIRAMERITAMRNQLAALNEELTILSQRDGLTQLFNRRIFEEKAADLWSQATRSKTPISILLLDIDHFKLYNDCYGHQAGDECIQQVANVLARCVNRSGDLVARYGGEEFIAVLPDTPESGAIYVCKLIRESIEALQIKHRDSSVSPYVTVSIGASVVNFTTGTDLQFQVGRADKALYDAKLNGRNCYVIREFNTLSKVLVIDEDDHSLDQVSELLTGHCTVIGSTHKEECCALAEEYLPDLILIDVKPDTAYADVCNALKSSKKVQAIPIVLLCSAENEELKQFGKDVHANDFVAKPLEQDRLLATINKYLHTSII